MYLQQYIDFAIEHDASDIHVSAGHPPLLRILGELQKPTFSQDNQISITSEVIDGLLQSEQMKSRAFDERGRAKKDFALVDAVSQRRLRVNQYMHDGGKALAMRLVPSEIRSFEQLGAPKIVSQLAESQGGLILITGPKGAGKSATAAAIIDHINSRRPAHISTIEDPIEHKHTSRVSLIHQRETSATTGGFAGVLSEMLRQDVDVIFLGEIRDLETIRLALTAAELNCLVIATMHSVSPGRSVNRIVDVFPGAEKDLIRMMLAESLKAVVSQRLILNKDRDQRLAVFETMVCTPAIRSAIKENRIAQIRGHISTGAEHGMETMEQALTRMIALNEITYEEALRLSEHPDDIKKR